MDHDGAPLSAEAVVVRTAVAADVADIVAFGNTVVPEHYAPMIGTEAALAMVRTWWQVQDIAEAVSTGLVVVAEDDGALVGMSELGSMDGEQVIWKLYLHSARRGRGLGPRLLHGLVDRLPVGAERVWIEHVAANARAGAFYEREGFTVQRFSADEGGEAATDHVWRVRQLPPR